jgi:vacuolar-type H+-ATPase subunit C/Vma6
VGYKVSDNDIREIARGGDIAHVVFRIYPELVPKLSGVVMETGGGLEQLERALFQLALTRCHNAFVGFPFHIGIPLGYVWLSENEINDLTIIIEAKAAGTPADKFVPMLIMGYV